MSVGELFLDDLSGNNFDQFSIEVFEQIPIGLIVVDRSGHILGINRYQEKISGIKRDNVVGECLYNNPHLGHSELDKILMEVIDKGQTWSGSKPLLTGDTYNDNSYFCEIRPISKFDVVVGAVMLTYEINEGLKPRRRFQGTAEELEEIFNNFGYGLMVITPDFVINKINSAQLSLFGIDKTHDCVGKRCYRELFGRNSVCQGCPAIDSFDTRLPAIAEMKLEKKNVISQSLNIRSFPLENNIVSRVILCCQFENRATTDNDTLELAELINQDYRDLAEKLKMLNSLHTGIFDSLPGMLVVIKDNNEALFWNRALEKYYDLPVNKGPGTDFFELLPELAFQEPRRLLKITFATGKSQQIECIQHRKFQMEAVIRLTTFLMPSHLPFRAVLLRIEDISDFQKKLKQDKLGDRIAALGKFSAKLAHNINNPLGTILNTIDFLRMDLVDKKDLESVQQDLETVRHQVYRISNFTNDLLSLASEPKESFNLLDINLVLEKTLAIIEINKKKPNIKIDFIFSKSVPLILGNEDRLELAFKNLLTNAIEAIETHGNISVTTMSQGFQSKEVMITINDNGHGIPEDLLPKVIDPYITTKKNVKGAGLGLTIAYSIILNHGGTMEIMSKVRRGTQVFISLPGAQLEIGTK